MNSKVKSEILKLINTKHVSFYMTHDTQHYSVASDNNAARVNIIRVADGKTKIDVIYLNDMAYLCSDRISTATDYDVKEVINAAFNKAKPTNLLAKDNIFEIPAKIVREKPQKPISPMDDFIPNKLRVEAAFLQSLGKSK